MILHFQGTPKASQLCALLDAIKASQCWKSPMGTPRMSRFGSVIMSSSVMDSCHFEWLMCSPSWGTQLFWQDIEGMSA